MLWMNRDLSFLQGDLECSTFSYGELSAAPAPLGVLRDGAWRQPADRARGCPAPEEAS